MSWPLHKTWFWERAPFFRVLAPLVAGIWAYELLPGVTAAAVVMLLLISIVAFAVLLLRRVNIAAINLVLASCIFLCAGYPVSYTHLTLPTIYSV